MHKFKIFFLTSLFWISTSQAETISTKLYLTGKAQSSEAGEIIFTDTQYGLLIKPELKGLTPGLHGLHLHQYPDCGDHGNHAGGHFDPQNTKSHQGPYGKGHLGDLPVLYVDINGHANLATLAPRLHVSDLIGLTVMLHEGGDNYSDNPPVGGGGSRMACGVITKNN